tara:strand:- start:230 stop:715 length:486 start_codon:yes stop_codon:yes gene_type:complete
MGKFKLPSQDDDWSGVHRAIRETIEQFPDKIIGKWVERDGDTSQYPEKVIPPEKWSNNTPFQEWLEEGCTGETSATHISGMGIVAETIGYVLGNRVYDAVSDMFCDLNDDLTEDGDEIDLEYHPVSDDLNEIAQTMVENMHEWTLGEVKEHVKPVKIVKEG